MQWFLTFFQFEKHVVLRKKRVFHIYFTHFFHTIEYMGWKSKEAKSEYDRKRYANKKGVKPKKELEVSTINTHELPEKVHPEKVHTGGSFSKRIEHVLKLKYPNMMENTRMRKELVDMHLPPNYRVPMIVAYEDILPEKRPLHFKL